MMWGTRTAEGTGGWTKAQYTKVRVKLGLLEEWKALWQTKSHGRSVALRGESGRICLFAESPMADS